MISLNCTSCKKSLEIDDAFAGGVCRCQFCGTIQTVPASLRKAARPGAAPTATTTAPKALYQKKAAVPKSTSSSAAPPEPAEASPAAAASAVPSRTRAAQPAGTAPETPEPLKKSTWQVGVAIGAAAALLIGAIAWLAF